MIGEVIEIHSLDELEELLEGDRYLRREIERKLELRLPQMKNFFEYCERLGGEASATIEFTSWGAIRSVTLSCRGARARRIEVDSWKEGELRIYRAIIEGSNGKAEIPYPVESVIVYTPSGYVRSERMKVETELPIDIELKVWVKKEEWGGYVPASRATIKIGS